MSGLVTIAWLTLHEAARKRILLATTICALAFIALYAVGFHFVAQGVEREKGAFAAAQRMVGLSAFTLAGLYAVNFLSIMSAVLLPIDTLSGEISSGVVQTLASKPIRRSDIVLGKWAAYALVVTLYVVVMTGGVLVVARLIGHYTPPRIHLGVPLMALEGVLFVSLSIWGGSRFSTVTNGVVAFGLYGFAFIGGWVEQIGSFSTNTATGYVGTVVSLIMPTESLWQLAAHHMQPTLMLQLHVTPFSPATTPSLAMVAWAAGWGIAALAGAVWTFRKRSL